MGDSAKNPVLDRRRVILDGAAEILAANGFHGARMAEIAGASGITGPALYRHFAGKDALHAAVIESGTEIVEDLMERSASAGSPDAILRATIAGMAREGIEHSALWVILLRDARHLTGEERTRHSRRWRAIVDDLSGRVRAVRPDLSRSDAELVGRAMLAFGASPSATRVRGMTDVRRRRLLERMLARLVEARFPIAGTPGPDTDVDRGSAGPGPGGPEPPVERAARREAIIDAAHHLFRRRGFHDVSMEDIAVAAGVTGPTVYSYFESKADLLVVAQQRGSAWLTLCLGRALRTEPTAIRRFTRVMTSYIDFAIDHGDTMAVLVRESCNLPDHVQPTVLRDVHDYTTDVAALLRSIRPDFDEPIARTVVCGCVDLVSFLSASRRYARWDGLRPRLLAFVDAVSSVGDS